MTQELRKLAEAATQGEWHQTPTCGIYQGRMIVTDDRAACIGETHNANATENAAYIAAANPAAILELLDRVEKAESKSEELQEALTNLTTARDRNEKLWIDSTSCYEYAKDVLKKYAMEASK